MAERTITASVVVREVGGSSPSPNTNASVAERHSIQSNDLKDAGSSPAGRAKLFVVVRKNMSAGAKACQAAHALRTYADAYPFIESKWWKQSNTLVILEHDDLEALEAEAHRAGVSCIRFMEPDWDANGVLTALALGPDAFKILRRLPLAFGKST